MEGLLELVKPEAKEWVARLTILDIANILNAMASIPAIGADDAEPDCEEPLPTRVYSDIAPCKGRQGEDEFKTICANLLSAQFTLINTAKQARSGDFCLEWRSPETDRVYRYLVDVKNYRSSVPTKEVEKFWRDIEASSYDGAFLISLHSRITGKNAGFQFEEKLINMTCLPIAYICSSDPTIISEVIKFMTSMTEVKMRCGISLTKSQKVMRSISALESSIDLFSRSRSNLQDIKLTLEKQFNRIFVDLLSAEHIFKTNIKNVVESLIEESASLEVRPSILAELSKCENFSLDDSSGIMHIWSAGQWDHSTVDSDSNEWRLTRTDGTSLSFKFLKKYTIAEIHESRANISEIVGRHKHRGKISKTGGIAVRFSSSTYPMVCEICNIPI